MADLAEILTQAKTYHAAGQVRDAEQLYRVVVGADSTSVEALYLLGAVCRDVGKPDEAIAHLRQAVQLRPDYGEAHLLLGSILAQAGQLDEAIVNLQQARRLKPESEEASKTLRSTLALKHERMGSTLSAQGKYQESLAHFRQALELAPDYLAALGNLGNSLKQLRKLDEAAECYRQLLRLNPGVAQAHNDLARIALVQGRHDEAIATFRRAIELEPSFADAHAGLALALDASGQVAEALDRMRRAVALMPDNMAAQFDLGCLLAKRNQFAEAEACFRRVVAAEPRNAMALNLLGAMLTEQGRTDEAMNCYGRALELDPKFAQAHYNRGTILMRQQKFDEAASAFEQALAQQPKFVAAHNNLAIVRRGQGKLAEAVAGFRRIVELTPEQSEAHNNLGAALAQQAFEELEPAAAQKALDEAEACYQQSLKLRSDYAEAYNNQALLLLGRKRLDAAIAACDKALRIDPLYANAHITRSTALLLSGRWAEGWTEYEWRLERPGVERRPFAEPRWNGETATDRTVLLHAEQGLGDSLQFIRYARLVKERVGKVVVECPAPLASLFKASGCAEQVVAAGEVLPKFDLQVPLASLPGVFGTTPDNVPADVPYLTPEPALVDSWRGEFSSAAKFKIGIMWQGNPRHPRDRARSIPLSHFAPLAKLPGVTVYSLQRGLGREQLQQLAGASSIVDLGDRLGDFSNTAALLQQLDLVISCDSATAHLAGALGLPVWVPLAWLPDWRWLLDREDSPWYPTMRLFRQSEPGAWPAVFGEIERAVAQQVASR